MNRLIYICVSEILLKQWCVKFIPFPASLPSFLSTFTFLIFKSSLFSKSNLMFFNFLQLLDVSNSFQIWIFSMSCKPWIFQIRFKFGLSWFLAYLGCFKFASQLSFLNVLQIFDVSNSFQMWIFSISCKLWTFQICFKFVFSWFLANVGWFKFV